MTKSKIESRSIPSNSSIAQPISVPASQDFDGNDGLWSTFLISIGTPPQVFRVLPATNGQETWLPIPEGCGLPGEPSGCGSKRGANIFNNSKSDGFSSSYSSTFQEMSPSIYNLIMEEKLGLSGAGRYGFDTVALGSAFGGTNGTGVGVDHQVIAEFAIPQFWLGFLPLSPKPTNFTAAIPSLMSNLASQGHIPSKSFGYTAGAHYEDKGALGSLVLGGYDASKFVLESNSTFSFATDDSRSLTVGLQSITAQRSLQGTVAPLASGILALIDSGVPEIWLPTSACAIFEEAFGLAYDKNTDRYLVNETTHTQLTNLNSTITFNIGNEASGGSTIAIELPYAAFDLQVGYPVYPNLTNYFPLRRAANNTQYTLGRTFLQGAYIIVDFERQNFSVAQTAFTSAPQSITAIKPLNDTSTDSDAPSSQHHLSTNAIAGITIAATALFFLVCLGFYFLIRQRRRRNRMQIRSHQHQRLYDDYHTHPPMREAYPDPNIKYELPTATPVIPHLATHRTPVPPPNVAQSQQDGSPTTASPGSNHQTFSSSETSGTAITGSNGTLENRRALNAVPADIISPLSTETRSTELETPATSSHRQGSLQARQELSGSETAAEAHTSIWGSADPRIRGRSLSHDGFSSHGGLGDESMRRGSISRSVTVSLDQSRSAINIGSGGAGDATDGGAASNAGMATMEPIYELSGESLGGVRIKSIYRMRRSRPQ